jgi:alpha-tubulin suppressor-like RCC1 family protein
MKKRIVLFSSVKVLSAGISLLAAITITQTLEASCTPPPAGSVGWWPGEGNANDVVGGDNGTLVGGATFAAGEVGQGFRLDGTNGYVQIADSAALKPTNVTVEAWVWLDPNLPANRGGEQIVFKKNTSSAWFEGYSLLKVTIDNGDGTYSNRFQFCVSRSGNQVAINSQTIAQRGVWYHVAATYDGNQSKLFVNGVLEATATPGFALDYDTTPVFIGTSGTWAPYLSMFGGTIDEASIYNRALSMSEIAAIYNAGSAGKCQTPFTVNGLVLWNTLGSDTEVSNSIYGSNLQKYVGGSWPDVAANTSYGPGEFGNAVGIGPGGYTTSSRVHNLVLDNLPQVINPNRGTIDVWFKQNSTPTPYVNGVIRIFDGAFGLNSGMNFHSLPPPNNLEFGLAFGGTTTTVNYDITASNGTWLNLAGVWDNAGIGGSADKLRLFVNGQLVAANTNATWGTTVGPQADIAGGQDSSPAGQFLVDNLKVFNHALTASEVLQVYSGGEGFNSGPPAISNFAPASGTSGTVVTLSGNNFSANASADIVYFGAVRANVLTASPTRLTVTVPVSATFAPITVTVNGWTAYADQPFTPTFAGLGQLDNTSLAPFVNLPTANGPGQVVIADLDGDGKPDLIIPDSYAGVISIYQNISTNGSLTAGSFGPRVDLPLLPTSGANPYVIVAADMDGDGRLDLVVLNPDSNVVSIVRNISLPGLLTTNSFAARIDLSGGNVMRGLVVQDLNGDGKPEIVTANSGDNTISVFQNLSAVGNISFAPRVNFATDSQPQGLVVGDLDGDGNPDLMAVNWNSSTLSVFRNLGTGGTITPNSFTPEVSIPTLATPFPIAIGDLDGDGKLDLVVGGSENSSAIAVYRNTSTVGNLTAGSFAAPVTFAAPGWVNSIALADLDGDGKLDIALVSQISSVFSIFKNVSQPGSFTTASLAARLDYPAGYNPNGIAIGDLDGDGRPDVVFANSYDNTISIYQNVIAFGVAPVITAQPTNVTVTVGGMSTFSVTAGGTAPLSYQWNFNGTNITGATNATLTLTNVQPAQAGNYAVLLTNFLGSAASSNAVLSVFVAATPPTILSQTPNQFVLLGNTATFSVNVSGSVPLSYFWQRNGVLIPGATNASFSLYNVQLSDSGSKFSCFVTNVYGSANSTNVSLKVINSTIANDLCSGAIVISNGSYTNVQSTVQATSFGDPVPDCVDGFGHGVWYQFTAPVTGQLIVDTFGSDFDTGLAIYTGSCDALAEVACNDDTGGVTSQVTIPTTAGTTYLIIAGGYGSDAGNLVLHLNHLTPPAFSVQPTNESVVISNTASFSATLTGALPMSFQWAFNGTPLADDGIHITGSATANLSISNITTADGGSYTLAVTNFLGSTNSSAAVLTVLTPPTFTTQPVGRSLPPGLPTIFNAAALGNPMPSYYQWQLNGTNIPGATSSSYTNLAVGTNDLGFYQVIASNSVGVATSTSAQLTFGPVAAWGLNTSGECLPPPGLSNVVEVAGNRGASFAVRTDGTVIPWGSGNVTNIPSSASNVVAVSTSDGSPDFALRSDGTVIGWPNYTAPVLSNIVSIASGYGFAYGLRAEGTLTNFYLGKNVQLPAGLNHITAIACGYGSALALRSDGTVAIAGTDGITNPPGGLNNVVAIAAGYSYAMVLKANGTVVAWGSGTGTNLPAGMSNIVAISAGNYPQENSGLAIRSDGTLLTWGDNNSGDKSPPAALTNLVTIAASAPALHALALVNDGRPVILHPPVGLTAYTGRSVTLQGSAVGAQPLSYQWLLNGTNVPGATNTSLILPNVQFGNAGNYQLFVSSSVNTALSLPAPLTVISNSALTFLSTPAGQTNYQGSKVTLGTTVFGSGPVSYQWYYSASNQTFTAVSGATSDSLVFDPALAGQSGYYRVVASNQFNTVTSPSTYERVLFAKAWGYLPADPPIIVTNGTAIAVGNLGTGNPYGHYLALKSDGTISSWMGSIQYPIYGQTNFSALNNSIVTAIAAGYGDSLALKSDGTVYAVGYGFYGETNVPSGLSGVVGIACGDYHDLALKLDGTIAAWGQNTYGQATNASYSPQYGYVPVTNAIAVAAGGNNSVALHADGSVVTWGQYGNLQYPVPFNVTNVIAVSAGGTHFLALRANGTVVGWGNNIYGQTTIPVTWSNIVAISAAGNHSVALRNDGTILTLGNYYNGPTLNPGSVPSDLANVVAIASSGDHDLGLFGTRAPSFTVQPWNRAIDLTARTNITLAAKCSGVQPVSYQWQLNGTNVPGATNDTLFLVNQPFATAPIRLLPTGVYQLVASNAYGVAASKFAKVTSFIPLATALNTPTDGKGNYLYSWTTSGNAQWFGETNVTHDGVSAAQSGGIGPLQQTILQTTVGTNWPGNYTFWWNVSSEQDFDFLEFRINGVVQTSISGSPGWQQVSIPVAAGTNVLTWRYSKDVSVDMGLDAGWVDQFAYIPAPPQITRQPVSQTVNMGANVTFSVIAIGPGVNYPQFLRYQWYQNGNPVGLSGPSLTLNNVGRAQNGTYLVTVTNIAVPGNITVSSNAVLKVLVPQLLGPPAVLPNGSFQLTSTDANGGLLSPSDLPNFEAQASTDLVNWLTLPNALSLTNGMLLLQDSGSTNYSARYYRILEH